MNFWVIHGLHFVSGESRVKGNCVHFAGKVGDLLAMEHSFFMCHHGLTYKYSVFIIGVFYI